MWDIWTPLFNANGLARKRGIDTSSWAPLTNEICRLTPGEMATGLALKMVGVYPPLRYGTLNRENDDSRMDGMGFPNIFRQSQIDTWWWSCNRIRTWTSNIEHLIGDWTGWCFFRFLWEVCKSNKFWNTSWRQGLEQAPELGWYKYTI